MKRVTSYFIILMLMTVSGFAQTKWEKYSGNPVLLPGAPGEWDSSGVVATGTLFDGSIYHMWYSIVDTIGGIGYATSPDGVNWTKHASNPVLNPGPEGTWDDKRPGSPAVVLVNSTFHMWYDIIDGINSKIGYATSSDGVNWTKHASNPILSGVLTESWESDGVFNPKVIYKDGSFLMWYSGWDSLNVRIGHATSTDGFNWMKHAGNPVMDIGSIDSWDAASVAYSSIVFNGTSFEMWYTGNDSIDVGNILGSGPPLIGYATSPDGLSWSKFEDNPILLPGQFPEWDFILSFLSDVIFDGSTYHMWYSGLGFNADTTLIEFAIGYATSVEFAISSISDVPEDQGGWVFLTWDAFSLDSSGQITQYGVSEYDEVEGWVSLGSVQAEQEDSYTFLAHTFGDSTSDEGIFWSNFKVTAHTTDPNVFYKSGVYSGYSVDNLAPAVPTGLLASVTGDTEIGLEWDAPLDEDFKYFAVYRSLEAGFDPTGMEPHAVTIDINFTDTDIVVDETYYYRLSAFDENGNESDFSQEVSAVITGVDGERVGLPDKYSLSQNYPNPFNPSTLIEYALPTAGEVSLSIYSLGGEEVVRLFEGKMSAGYHQVIWNASNIASGIYFYRLQAGDFVQTRKMVLLK